jgi:four helix bundle protein
MSKNTFSFEELVVWQKAVNFASTVIRMTERIETERRHYRVIENCEAAAVFVASNIAEGNGRHSTKEYIHFLYIARGSLYESITQLIIFHNNGWISPEDRGELKVLATEIGKMLSSLIKSHKKSITYDP